MAACTGIEMMHSMKDDNINALFDEVLSWSVDDILKRKQPPFKVETIPSKFKTCVDYRAAFRNPTLEEVWYQINSGMDTSSRGQYVQCYEKTISRRSAKIIWSLDTKLHLKDGNIPRRGDLMLLSKRGLESRDQIIKDGSFCTILVVTSTTTNNDTIVAHVWLSHSPYGGNLNQQSSYQVVHLANLTTVDCSWEAMTRVCNKTPEIFNLILTKNNDGDDGEYGQFADLEGAFGGFKLNDSQIDAVASCISASTCSKKSFVRLIWGPPGTGKTKTVSVFLLMLLKFPGKHRTLVCAPTNTALVQLASSLVSLVKESTEKSYLLQDIIMFGSGKLKTGSGLSEISLDSRAEKSWQRDKCLRNAKIVICTPYSSSRLNYQQFDTLVIDEAANLKEFELVIPLAIDGIKHVVLIGDEKQLQSVVMSPIAKEAKYGRSLFERLCEIGWHKKLLDKQYRMHPFISKFSNEMFYDGKIKDVTEAKSKLHVTGIFCGHYFGNYSFFHVEDGIEEHDGQSLVNMVEVEIATAIVKRIAKACTEMKKKTGVGVISQYAAQVTALRKRTEEFQNHGFVSVKIQTVDSFQGDEKDIIILSTVRCNHGGDIGFLDSDRRANVALTRARNWLWILGHEPTLTKSKSIWSKLVKDAQERNCFFNARDD